MDKIKFTRKDLKKPDEFISVSGSIYEWLILHQKEVLYGVAGFLILFLVVLLVHAYLSNNESKANDVLFEANSLAGFTGAGNDEKMTEGSTKKALEDYDKLIKKFPMTRTAGFAGFYKGNLLYRDGKYEEALKSFEYALGKLKGATIKSMILMDMSYAMEALSRWDGSCANLKRILDLNAYPQMDLLYFKLGNCFKKTGKVDEADKYYRMIASEYPSSEFSGVVGTAKAGQ